MKTPIFYTIFVWTLMIAVTGETAEIIVENADSIWRSSSTAPQDFGPIKTRVVVEYANSIYHNPLEAIPVGLKTVASQMASRIFIQYAGTTFRQALIPMNPAIVNFTATVTGTSVNLIWTNQRLSDFPAGTLIVYSQEPISWLPKSGMGYKIGEEVDRGVMVGFVGKENHSSTPFTISKLSSGVAYNFAAFAYDSALIYSIGSYTSSEVGGVKYPPWDVNQDGIVNILDLVLVGRHFGEDYRTVVAAIAASLPEIGTFSGKTTDVQMVVQNKVGLQGRRLLWVDINTGPVEDLYGCQFSLVFDPKVLEVVGVKAGDVLARDGTSIYGQVSDIDNRMGKITGATYVRQGAQKGVNASGTLATVIFEVKDTSSSDGTRLTLSDITLADADARLIKALIQTATLKWEDLLVPEKSSLLQNFPNPFNPETWIPYQLATDADVVLKIYDSNGRLVRELALGNKSAGMYTSKDRAIYWDGRNAQGEPVASGVYFVELRTKNYRQTRRMVLLK